MMLSAQAYDWNNAVIKGQGFVDGIVYSPAAPNTFFAHTDVGGAYRWDQSASKWTPVTDWIPLGDPAQNFGAQTMAADPTDASKVYLVIGTYGSTAGILRSSDGGRTWLRTDVNGIKVDGNGWGRGLGDRIAVDPNSPNILFYGTQYYDSTHRGLWRSTDSAATWNQVSSFTSYGEQWDNSYSGAKGVGSNFVIFDKSTGTPGSATPVIYTTSATIANTNTKLYRTTNGGTTWSPMPNQPTTTNFPLRAALSADGTVMYVTYGSQAGPLASADGGGVVYKVTNPSSANPTWTEVATNAKLGLSSGIFGPIAIDPTDNNTIYTATMNSWPSNIFRSTNGGSSWTALNPNSAANRDNSPAPIATWATIHSLTDLEIDPFNRNVAMFNTGGGIWRTTNLTATVPTWTFFDDGLEETAGLEIVSPNTGDVHVFSAMGDSDGFRHADLSVSPPALGQSQSPSLQEGTSDDIDVAWNDANYLIRLSRSTSPYVQYSNDNGVTWAWMPSTGVSGTANPDEYNANLGMTALSADGLYVVYQPGNNSTTNNLLIYSSRSTLTGAWSSWLAPATNRPPEGAKVVADLVAPHTFYAISGNATYRSTDGGVSWTTMTTNGAPGNIKWVRVVPGYSGHLLASAQWNGLFRSTDGGATWTRINSSAVTTANGVGVGMAAPGQNYPAIFVAGTVNGINGFFRSDDQGATWVTISDLAHQYGYTNLIQGDPRIYGRVYLGARGLVYGDIHTSPTSLPSGWSTQDIGAVGSAGAAGSSSTGAWELTGGGAGIASTSDEFRFAYTTLNGDGSITARVMGVPSDNPSNHNALAGVMIRNSLNANSAQVLMAMTPGSVNGAVFKYRSTTSGSTSSASSSGVWNPYWVRLVRSGSTFTAYRSADGITWTQVGAPQTITMGATVYVGLATTASDDTQVNTSTFQNVSVTGVAATSPAAPTSLGATTVSALYLNLTWTDNANESDFVVERATDSGFSQNLLLTSLGMGITGYSDTSVSPSTTYYYRIRAYNNVGYSAYSNLVNYTTLANTSIFTANQDLGSPSPAGSYNETSGTYTVNGGGTDINGTSDKFQFVYKSLTGDGSIIARVINVEDTDSSAKAGVMFRDALTIGSANAFVALTPDNGATFQWRSNANGSTNVSTFIGAAIPYWVRLTRSGSSFTAYRSSDGVTWTQIGSTVTLSMGSTVYVGLAVTSHSSGILSTSIFSNVAVNSSALSDYNGNGVVDAADYVVWRKTLGSTTNLLANGDDTGASAGIIDQADYAVWRANFGNTAAAAGSGSAQSAVNADALPVVTTATTAALSSPAVDAAIAESVLVAVPLRSTYLPTGFPTVKRALARPGRFDYSLPDNNALLALASRRPLDRQTARSVQSTGDRFDYEADDADVNDKLFADGSVATHVARSMHRGTL